MFKIKKKVFTHIRTNKTPPVVIMIPALPCPSHMMNSEIDSQESHINPVTHRIPPNMSAHPSCSCPHQVKNTDGITMRTLIFGFVGMISFHAVLTSPMTLA